MTAETEILNSLVGRRIAELRNARGLSQSELASMLSRQRTQSWVSTVESGRRNLSVNDIFEIASIFETTIAKLTDTPFQSGARAPLSFSDYLRDLSAKLPIETPLYLQRDLGEPDFQPISYKYTSGIPCRTLFDSENPVVLDALSGMLVERYYSLPKIDPTDVVTFRGDPHPASDKRVADRVLIKLKEPHAGLLVHPGVIQWSGKVEMTLLGHPPQVFSEGEYEILGVLVARETFYVSSRMRAGIQRRFGIAKDDRLE